MIDTHTHLNLSPLLDNYQDVWQRAQSALVTKAVIIAADSETSRRAVSIAGTLDGTFASVGLHPDVINPRVELDMEHIREQMRELETLAANPRVVAIGECGLDYVELHKLSGSEALRLKNNQKQLFGLHIHLAKKLHLPLSIHCRNTKGAKDIPQHHLDAYKDLIDTLEHFSTEDGVIPSFVLHCMSGDMEYLKKGIELGGYISFAGNVTYPSAQNLRDLLHQTPKDRLLLETDAPFLSPKSKRGTPNEPAYIAEVFAFVAEELGMSIEELDALTTTNAGNLFHFKI